jgi:anion transporter
MECASIPEKMIGPSEAEAPFDALAALLRDVPFFADLERVEIARLIGALERVEAPVGATIFEEGTEADALYLLASGRVSVTVRAGGGERHVAALDAPAHFGELGLLLSQRTGSARTLTDAVVWRLPRARVDALIRDRPAIGVAMAATLADLLDRRSREHVGAPVGPARAALYFRSPAGRVGGRRRWVGLALGLAVPALLWITPPPFALDVRGWHILAIVAGAAIGWLLEPIPDFVVTLAMAAAWGIAGLVRVGDVFSGFATASWVVALSAFVLAAAMVRSGLLFRIALLLVRAFPAGHTGQVLGMLVGGALLTPLVPLGLARVATASSLAQELAGALSYPPRSRASAGLGFAALIGYGSFGGIVLTGLAMNFFVQGLLPAADRARFGWTGWLVGAAPAGAILLVGAALALLVLFAPGKTTRTTSEIVRHQQHALGRLTRRELVALAGIAVLFVGLLGEPALHLDATWLALSAVVVVLAGGGLQPQEFRASIDWGFLVLFGILLGLAGVLHDGGIDAWIALSLSPLARAVADPGPVVLFVGLVAIAIRLVLPWVPSTLLLAVALVPAAPSLGLPAWVVGFVIILAAQTWIVPGLYEAYTLARSTTRGELFTDRQALTVGVAMTALTLVALGASVVYWRTIGLLP